MGTFISIMLIVVLLLVFYRGLRYGFDYRSKENLGLLAVAFVLTWLDPGSDFLNVTKRVFYGFVLVYIVLFAALSGRKRKNDV